ncbi:single-stranded DNA-binding protein [Candidatus Woesebacteria bacterium]|nr:single-stranded DNA-binding protein [Candidatus Woesebacteria bacterium]QQG47306.1 MAG: single-stranded DNA-binding protein [Candidatus Woesebacteria bacterium]
MARSLNKVILIGNLTRDPELRYTPQGTAVATFGIATNRQWKTESGEAKEEAEFHKIVVWDKLAEIVSQNLAKGRKVYAEGRLQTRNWQAQDGTKHTTTEIVVSDIIFLDSRAVSSSETQTQAQPEVKETKTEESTTEAVGSDDVSMDDIPF